MKSDRLLFLLMLCLTFNACEKSQDEDRPQAGQGVYVLNNGNMGDNDADIGIYSPSSKTFVSDVFFSVNGQKLGDLGQDILTFNDEVYIAVNGSRTIFVTDLSLKIKEQINVFKDGVSLSPKYLASAGDKVYVTYYEGYVGEIDSADHSVRITQAGPNPEGLAVAGDCLYVANSGGMSYPDYNNTVSVISIEDFIETKVIEVNVNPVKVVASSDGEYVYVSSYGNYSDVPSCLQVIETSAGRVSNLDYSSVSSMAMGNDDTLYILAGGYDDDWNPLPGIVYKHDMVRNTPSGTFVSDGTLLPDAYSISVSGDYVYVGCSDYRTTGDVYVFTSDGRLHDKFDSLGLNPLRVW